MQDQDLPNLFIIGAPKCGTSSMFRWLSSHPEVCASNPKETWFFADRELDYIKVRAHHRKSEIADYLRYFEPADEQTLVRMEGSTHYLYSDVALEFLSQLSPIPKLIVQLRDPALRIWSHFNYVRQRAVDEVAVSFPDYLRALLASDDSFFSEVTQEPWQRFLLQNQLTFSDYHEHLEKWLGRFARQHIKILVLEDVMQRERQVVQQIANWLSIDPGYYEDFDFRRQNVTRSRRAKRMRSRLRPLARILPAPVAEVAKRTMGRRLAPLKVEQTAADRAAIDELRDWFLPGMRRLEQAADLDLSLWRN